MKQKVAAIFLLLTFGLFFSLVAATTYDVIETGFPVTIIIGNPSGSTTTTTVPQNITIDNPATINFQIVARNENGQSQTLGVNLYDHVGHDFLNTNQFTGLGYLTSPSSWVDFEFKYDSSNLIVSLNGLDITNMNDVSSQITIQKVTPQISNFTIFNAYKVDLPVNFNLTSAEIVLKLKFGDVTVDYNSIRVYRCTNYDTVTNNCLGQWETPSQALSVDPVTKTASLTVDHFSIYLIGTGGQSTTTSTTTTTTPGATTTTAPPTTTTTQQNSNNQNSGNSGSGGGNSGGGVGGGLPLPTTTTTKSQTTTTTTTVPSTTTTEESTNNTSSIPTGLFANVPNLNYFAAGAVVLISAGAATTYYFKKRNSFSSSWYPKSYFKSGKKSRAKTKKSSKETMLSM